MRKKKSRTPPHFRIQEVSRTKVGVKVDVTHYRHTDEQLKRVLLLNSVNLKTAFIRRGLKYNSNIDKNG